MISLSSLRAPSSRCAPTCQFGGAHRRQRCGLFAARRVVGVAGGRRGRRVVVRLQRQRCDLRPTDTTQSLQILFKISILSRGANWNTEQGEAGAAQRPAQFAQISAYAAQNALFLPFFLSINCLNCLSLTSIRFRGTCVHCAHGGRSPGP